jgi:hypothetical protein
MNVQEDADPSLIRFADDAHGAVSAAQCRLFSLIAEIDTRQLWRDSGARDMAQWISMRYGISCWKANRWIAAAHALKELPITSAAFASGALSVDKVVELTRFAAPGTEERLVAWATDATAAGIRRKADLAVRTDIERTRDADATRSLWWEYFDDGNRFALHAELPAAQGTIVARALERMGDSMPDMPGEDRTWNADARRADAFVALCSARIAGDADPDRANVVVHAPLEALLGGPGSCEIEGGPVIPAETAERLLCSSRTQVVLEGPDGQALGVGRITSEPPAWMVRQLRFRDQGCTFPGCGTRRFTQAHHVRWWSRGGRTDLDNLTLVCSFHHKLVHEHGWSLRLLDGRTRWYRPDGRRHRCGPAPPRQAVAV